MTTPLHHLALMQHRVPALAVSSIVPTLQCAPRILALARHLANRFVRVFDLCQAAPVIGLDPLAQDLPATVNGSRGRITIYCVAETLNRDLLTKKLRERGPQFLLHSYPDVLYGRYHKCVFCMQYCR